jgi:hypothetical protein
VKFRVGCWRLAFSSRLKTGYVGHVVVVGGGDNLSFCGGHGGGIDIGCVAMFKMLQLLLL